MKPDFVLLKPFAKSICFQPHCTKGNIMKLELSPSVIPLPFQVKLCFQSSLLVSVMTLSAAQRIKKITFPCSRWAGRDTQAHHLPAALWYWFAPAVFPLQLQGARSTRCD